MSADSGNQRPNTCLLVVSALLSSSLLLVSLGATLFGLATCTASHSHAPERFWGVASMVLGGLLFAASYSALRFLLVRKRAIWHFSLVTHGLTMFGDAFVILQGFDMVAAAQQRWDIIRGLAALFSEIVGIVVPGIIGLVALANGCLLLSMWRDSRR